MMVRAKRSIILMVVLLGVLGATSFGSNVTYDHRALIIDGKRRVLVSGAIQYPRSTPEMWPSLIQNSKDGGLDVIDTYVFWNLHEPVRGQYDFSGRNDLVKFVKLVGEAGLYVFLRIGPYICAEWNFGGIPLWVHFIPGIILRTDNEPFKEEMQRFTTFIVDIMKSNKLYASQGGPIILSQIENEYGYIKSQFGSAGQSYIRWAANMAVSLDIGVPWVMCVERDAPDPLIDACNGFYCDTYTPNSNQKPKIWAENWTGWYTLHGNPIPYRPVEDLAFAVARFYQKGGTMQNYYMVYHEGTNFGRTTGGPFYSTTYWHDSPIDEYGIVRQPKWGHLKDVNKAIKLCEAAMVESDPKNFYLGPNIEATIYKTGSGLCAAFLANLDTQSDAIVNFSGSSYQLPAWSVSILPDCKNVVLNTAKINSASVLPKFIPQSLKYNVDTSRGLKSYWTWFGEPIGISKSGIFVKPGLLDQIDTTADKSDYTWYSLSIAVKADHPILENGSQIVLHVESLGHGLHAFINRKLIDTRFAIINDHRFNKIHADIPLTLNAMSYNIDLLSLTMGLQNYGAYFDTYGAGVTGPVSLRSYNKGLKVDLPSKFWTCQVGLKGEDLNLYNGGSLLWDYSALPKNQSLIWYKTSFDAPDGIDPVALNFTGMGKGEAWVNGQSIGRYWLSLKSQNYGCTDSCDYRGFYDETKCLTRCGKPPQQLYHVPRSWMKDTGNILVVFEEIGGDPSNISFVTKQLGSICSNISESHPPPVDMWDTIAIGKNVGPILSLECPSRYHIITSIKFASFGTPQGACGNFRHGSCTSSTALPIVQKACLGAQRCRIKVSKDTFGNPCEGVAKSLVVEAICA